MWCDVTSASRCAVVLWAWGLIGYCAIVFFHQFKLRSGSLETARRSQSMQLLIYFIIPASLKCFVPLTTSFNQGCGENETSLKKYFKWKPIYTVPPPTSRSVEPEPSDSVGQPGQSCCNVIEHQIWKQNVRVFGVIE